MSRSPLVDDSVWLDRQMEQDPFFCESGEGAYLATLIRERNEKLKRFNRAPTQGENNER